MVGLEAEDAGRDAEERRCDAVECGEGLLQIIVMSVRSSAG